MSEIQTDLLQFIRKKDYVFVKELGSGSFGKTVLMKDETIEEYLVCKKYSPSALDAHKYFQYFTKEIKLLYKISHENIVRIYNHYLYPATYSGFIIMEHIEGSNINVHIKANPDSINDIFVQVITGFKHLETIGILHRDIRYGNIMVNNNGVAKIIDFGFGKSLVVESDANKSITNDSVENL
jgi:serine/threonine protein kinase